MNFNDNKQKQFKLQKKVDFKCKLHCEQKINNFEKRN